MDNGKEQEMTIQTSISELSELFAIFDDPKDKFVQLMDMARESAGLKENEQTEQNKIYGCTSQAWIVREKTGDSFTFRTDSDAMIVKGLLFLIERVFNGHSKNQILGIDGNQFLTSVGLESAISSQRTNGFSNAIHKIQTELLK